MTVRSLQEGPQSAVVLSAAFLLTLLSSELAHGATADYLTRWRGGNGKWTDAAKWTMGTPTSFREADVGGNGTVEIPQGNFTTAMLRVGTEKGDRTKVQVDGGHVLVRQDSLIVGEHTGGVAQFVLNDGSVEDAMDIFVGGATGSAGRMNTSSLTVRRWPVDWFERLPSARALAPIRPLR